MEVPLYIRRHQGAKCARRAIVTNVIYHKFSHGAAFYTLNGKNVNVMLEYYLLLFSFAINEHQLILIDMDTTCVYTRQLIYSTQPT